MTYLRMVSELPDKFMTFSLCGYIDTADNNDKAALLSEIQMLKQAGKHPNIVNLVGACTKGGKLTIKLDNQMSCLNVSSHLAVVQGFYTSARMFKARLS